MSEKDIEQLSFGEFEATVPEPEPKIIDFTSGVKTYSDETKIVFAKYEKEEKMNPAELFNGFDTLNVITYSYGLKFIEEISDKFEDMTVIIGNEKLVDGSMFELIVASQMSIPPCIRKYKKLVQRVTDGTVTFCRVNDIISHQKIYLLSSKEGKRRVILGSANFSAVAWGQSRFTQKEDFVVFDDDEEAYSAFNEIFDEIQSVFSKPIEEEKITTAIETAKEELEELPFIDEIIKSDRTALILDQTAGDEKQQVVYLMKNEVGNLETLQSQSKKKFTKTDKLGRTLLLTDNVHTLIKTIKRNKGKDFVDAIPKFFINCDIEQAFFNDNPFDLTPNDNNNLINDINILLEYFKGYDDFIGTDEEKSQAKRAYYKMLNYIFLSPFIAMLRMEAYNTGYGIEFFPMYAIIQGKKSAGKSQFVDAARQFMFPDVLFQNLVSKDFTQTTIGKCIKGIEGVPMHVEDLTETQFNKHSGNIIKNETDILNERIKNHGVYIITTNEVQSLPAAIAKRTYYAHIPLTQKNTNSVRKKKFVNSLLQQITGQLYISYLQRMIPKVNDLTTNMENFTSNSPEKIEPDIFKLSSETLMELFAETEAETPSYITVLTYDDYFDWENVRDETTEWFQNECRYRPEAFSANRKQNTLEYNAGPAPERNFDKQKPVDIAYNRLPEELNAKPIGDKVIMNLTMAEQYFGVHFKESVFRKGAYKIEVLRKNKTK